MNMIIDLSLPIDDTLVETHAATIERITHKAGVEHFNWVVMSKQPNGQERFDKGERVATAEEIPDGEMLSLEIVSKCESSGLNPRETKARSPRDSGRLDLSQRPHAPRA